MVMAMAGLWPAGADTPDTPHTSDTADLQALVDAAEPGEVVEVPPGVYQGPVVIDRSLRLVGREWPVVDGGGTGHVLEITAPDVRVEGLVLRNSGIAFNTEDAGVMVREAPGAQIVGNRLEDVLFGVYVHNSKGVLVEGNTIGSKDLDIARRGDGIRLYGSGESTVRANRVVDGRDMIVWFSDDVVVEQNEVRNSRYGAHLMYSDRGVVRQNRFESNTVGLWLMFSHDAEIVENVIADSKGSTGMGLGLKDCDTTTIVGNRIVGNEIGLYNDTSPFSPGAEILYRANLWAGNDVAVEFLPSVHNNVFTENAFVGNRQQVASTGSGPLEGNSWSLDGRGNHWGDYAGYDSDGDGIGEVPYQAVDLFGDLSDRHPELELFADTPAARAVDLAARTFPVLRPEPRAVDDAPLVAMPAIPAVTSVGGGDSQWPLLAASTLLMGIASCFVVGIAGLGRRDDTAGLGRRGGSAGLGRRGGSAGLGRRGGSAGLAPARGAWPCDPHRGPLQGL